MASGHITGNTVNDRWYAYADWSTSESNTSVTLTVKPWLGVNGYNCSYNNVTGGAFIDSSESSSGSVSVNKSYTEGLTWYEFPSASKSWNRTKSQQTIYFSSWATFPAGSSNWAGTSNAYGTLVIDPLPSYTVPGTPTVTATRSSDTSINVTWSLKQPTNGSITSNRIEVKIDEEGWTTISSSLSGSATSYTYSSSSANHRYQFRVASSSSAGQSDYGESEYVYTTPAAPTGGYGVIRGTIVGVTALVDNIKYSSGYEWQRSANGSTGWTNINGAQSSISDTYGGSTAPYYRVRCVGIGGLVSAYSPAFQVSKGYNIYVNSSGPTPDKINFYVPPGSSIKSIKILV